MALTLPTSVKVFNLDYRIIEVEDLPELGTSDPTRQIIKIRVGLPPQQLVDTLVHEMLHAAYCAVDLSPRNNPTEDFTTSEEHVVRVSTFCFMTLLRDNPELRVLLLTP